MLANFERPARGRTLPRATANAARGPRAVRAATTDNLAQMTDTLKRQPWRILWPSTKKYDASAASGKAPTPAPGGVAAASPTTARERRSLDYGAVPTNEKGR